MMTAVLVSIISRVITSQQFFLYNSITFISISIASIPVSYTHLVSASLRQAIIHEIQVYRTESKELEGALFPFL